MTTHTANNPIQDIKTPADIFYAETPGPFSYRESTDGVDATFEVFCEYSGEPIVSIHYWTERLSAETKAWAIAQALNLQFNQREGRRLGLIGRLFRRP